MNILAGSGLDSTILDTIIIVIVLELIREIVSLSGNRLECYALIKNYISLKKLHQIEHSTFYVYYYIIIFIIITNKFETVLLIFNTTKK